MKVKIKKLVENAVVPARHSEGAVGYDLVTTEDATVLNVRAEDKAVMLHTGLSLEIPKGYHGKIYLRSSIGMNTKLRLANQTGIIDSDYRGEIMLPVDNMGTERINIAAGTRIAQLVIEKNIEVYFEEAPLSVTKRGKGGFGSTDAKVGA